MRDKIVTFFILFCTYQLHISSATVLTKSTAFLTSLVSVVSGVCITEQGTECVFPFKARGTSFSTCTYEGGFTKPWCSTKVDTNGDTVLGNWGDCPTNDPNCPIDRDSLVNTDTTSASQECPSVPVRMSLDIANSAMNSAIEKAKQMGKNFNVAVLDPAAHMVAFNRMDGAALGSIDVSIKKAKTSSLFGIESSLLGVISQPGASAYGAEQTNGGLVGFGGGLPLKSGNGEVIGSIGVSGGTVDEDVEVATAGADAVSKNY